MISEDAIDKILGDTFPASDPPSWTLGIEQATHIDQSEHETQKQKNRTRVERRLARLTTRLSVLNLDSIEIRIKPLTRRSLTKGRPRISLITYPSFDS